MYKCLLALIFSGIALGQVPNPTQATAPQYPGETPVFRVTATAHSLAAINFHHRQGSTSLHMVGTSLMPQAKGEAHVDSKTGATKVDVSFEKMMPAQVQGDAFLTFVLWAITPEGRPVNLGEVHLNGENSRLEAATDLQAFGLIVTAEPYYAVTQPSDVVVMEGAIREGDDPTTGIISMVDAKYGLLEHGSYDAVLPAADRAIVKQKNDMPLDLKEAWQAMAIAKRVGAETYAADTMQKADTDLRNAQAFWASTKDTKRVETLARGVSQEAEDARILTLRRRNEEQIAAEKRDADAKLAAAQNDADREAARREAAEAESKRRAEEADAALIAKASSDAEAQRLAAEKARATMEADAARAKAEQAEKDRIALRIQLRDELNKVLETRDSARGLIVNMSDVLFDTNQYSLRPGAREKLAKVSGILLSHPELKLAVEGHTDSTGTDEYNQKLSENRAESVRTYLVEQGVTGDSITAHGFGKTRPVATNDTAAGRQQNRRVEIVVSGDTIQTTTSQTESPGGAQ